MVNMATKNTHIKLYNQPKQYSLLDDSQGGFWNPTLMNTRRVLAKKN